MAANQLAPPPPGFELDPPSAGAAPPPPPGFQLDGPQKSQQPTDPRAQFGQNVIKSAGNFAANTASALAHPLDTAKNIGMTALGAVEKPVRNVGEWVTGQPIAHTPEENMVDAIGQSYKDRYGSLGKAAKTAFQDPVGTAADISMVAGGAGGALKAAGMGGRVAEGLGTVSRYTNPLTPVAAAASKAVPSPEGLQTTAKRWYQSALKPVPSTDAKDVAAMVRTGLNEKIGVGKLPFSQDGLSKTRGKIDDINATVDSAIQDAKAKGATVDPVPVAAETKRSLKAFDTGDPADQSPILGMRNRFLEKNSHPSIQTTIRPMDPSEGTGYVPTGTKETRIPTPIPIDEAQAMKRANYRINRESAYGEQVGAAREARKDIARGLKDGVYAQLPPEIRALGPHEKILIDLEDALERYANRHGNRDLGGIAPPLAAAGVKAVTGNGWYAAGAGLVKSAAEYPPIKSRLAILMNKAAQRARTAPPSSGNLRLPLASVERLNAATSQEPQE